MARILVVDDEPDVRAALGMLLEEAGHTVIELDDGANVMEVASRGGLDLVVLDLSMPRVDGFTVLDSMRRDPATSGIPVIVVSARGRPDDKALAKSLGALDYVNKPWSEGEIEFRIQMALDSAERKWIEDAKRRTENGDRRPGGEPVRHRMTAASAASVTARRLAPPDSRNGSGVSMYSTRSSKPGQPRRPSRVRRIIRKPRRRAA